MVRRLAVLVVVLSCGRALADPAGDTALTRRIVAREAAKARHDRHVAGAVMAVYGVAAVIGGYWLVRDGYDRGLGGIVECGAGMFGVLGGSFGFLGTGLALAIRTPQEELHAQLEEDVAAGHGIAAAARARRRSAELADNDRKKRPILYGVGVGTLALGAAGAYAYVVERDRMDKDDHRALGGVSALFAALGTAELVVVASKTSWLDRSFGELRTSAMVVPVPSGAMLSLAGRL